MTETERRAMDYLNAIAAESGIVGGYTRFVRADSLLTEAVCRLVEERKLMRVKVYRGSSVLAAFQIDAGRTSFVKPLGSELGFEFRLED